MPTIIANVTRSRRSCRNSLLTIAHQRRSENHDVRAHCASSCRFALACCPVVGRALHEVDEDVLEAGVDRAAVDSRRSRWSPPAASARARAASRPVTCSVSPNADGLLDARHAAQPLGERGEIGPADRERGETSAPRSPRAAVPCASRRPYAMYASLWQRSRLVHVVRADEHRDALRGEPVQLLPEFAPRIGIDARGRLVEQEQARPVQHARRERQALLPAAGQRARELVLRGP